MKAKHAITYNLHLTFKIIYHKLINIKDFGVINCFTINYLAYLKIYNNLTAINDCTHLLKF